jgi:hypothetical protein
MPTTLGSVITFNAIIDNVPAYMLVTETPEIIEARLELKYR